MADKVSTDAVYLLYDPTARFWKIGHGDPESRFRSLRAGRPSLQFRAAVRTGAPAAIERQLHGFFAGERREGEWFSESERLNEWACWFEAQGNVARDFRGVAASWATLDLWPWSARNTELADENGQLSLFPEAEGLRDYTAPRGHGKGQTSSRSEDWYTHGELADLTRELYGGTIDLDPMSCHEANLTVRADRIYTAEMDGLLHPWYGRMLWNPPWGGAQASSAKKRGLKKLLDSYARGEVTQCTCILNANAITTAWFAPLLAFPVCLPPRRIAHYGPNGAGGAPNSGTVIVYVGPYTDRFAQVFGRIGRIMVPLGSISEQAMKTAEDYDEE